VRTSRRGRRHRERTWLKSACETSGHGAPISRAAALAAAAHPIPLAQLCCPMSAGKLRACQLAPTGAGGVPVASVNEDHRNFVNALRECLRLAPLYGDDKYVTADERDMRVGLPSHA
jgi:hypothetical protein